MSEWIAELERRLSIIQSENTELREQMISNILVDADRYLATERQQLIDTFKESRIANIGDFNFKHESAETYYNNTFKTQ